MKDAISIFVIGTVCLGISAAAYVGGGLILGIIVTTLLVLQASNLYRSWVNEREKDKIL